VSEVLVPDIGEFSDVPVIEILVAVGDRVEPEQGLITLESDKATMEVPAPAAGTVAEILVAVGDEVSEGTPVVRLQGGADRDPEAEAAAKPEQRAPAPERGGRLLVIGSGPGGYTAAFRAADLGLEVVLVERYSSLGGICLNVGCIPSKALLHAARVITEVEEAEQLGITYGEPTLDVGRLDRWKQGVVDRLTDGLAGMAKRRKVKVVTGEARFTGPSAVDVDGTRIEFDHCIIAAGSRPLELPGLPADERIVDSTGALALQGPPASMLVIGGGIIGLEMACVYDALGTRVSVVELTPELIPGCDRDLVRPLQKRIEGRYEAVMLATKVTGIDARKAGLDVHLEGEGESGTERFERVLVAVGRRANGDQLELELSGVSSAADGVIGVDEQQRTNVEHIFAIGDVTGEPMLAHKATAEAVVAAEVIAGHDVAFDVRSIPSVAYTDPEVAWTGITETEAAEQGLKLDKGSFPWAASGRALTLGRSDGMTKVLLDPESRRVLGAGAVGPNAGELIAEAALAIEMGADAADLGLTVHPHPTLSETMRFAAEVAEGIATDIYAPKR
jgi:dihydrolipoamide dehydrogenase